MTGGGHKNFIKIHLEHGGGLPKDLKDQENVRDDMGTR